jgi:hypothetical protein
MKRLTASIYGSTKIEEDLNYYFPQQLAKLGIEGVECKYDGGVVVEFSDKPMNQTLLKALIAEDEDPYDYVLTQYKPKKDEIYGDESTATSYEELKQMYMDNTTVSYSNAGARGNYDGASAKVKPMHGTDKIAEELEDSIADTLDYLMSGAIEKMEQIFEADMYEESEQEGEEK